MCRPEGQAYGSSHLARFHAKAAIVHTLAFLVSFALTMSNPNKILVDGFPVAIWIAIFFGVTALAELIAAQVREMRSRMNAGYSCARWFEYSISATVMLVAIAQLSTVTNQAVLIMVVVVPSILTMVTGYLAEMHKSLRWFYVGCVVGIVPWIPIAERFFSNVHDVPDFVIAIFVSLFILFLPFPIIAYLYITGRLNFAEAEYYYTWASLTAKIALGIQVLAGALREDDNIEY